MLIVQKYGGSSLQSTERIRHAAERMLRMQRNGHEVVAVCSAMGDTSDELIDLAERINPDPPTREMDMLLTSGERVSNALVAMAVYALGGRAESLSGEQAGIHTDAAHGRARITEVVPSRVRQTLDRGAIALVAGFQGVNKDTKDTTTLGRGGSDVTAVALAAALKADVCEIYTDVDGVFSADPRIVESARLLETISYAEILEMSATGAKVLMSRCVEYGRRHDVDICVRSSFTDHPGTLVSNAVEGTAVEDSCVTGVTHTRSVAKVTVEEIPAEPSAVAHIFEVLAVAGISIDMLQNINGSPRPELTFTVMGEDGPRTLELLEEHRAGIGYGPVRCDAGFGQVSLVGAGIRSEPGIVATLCRTLAGIGIGVQLISASEIRLSALCRADQLDAAVRALHSSFGLDSTVPAVVYAGTGR
ncbi:aspartate kinase [Streptomyces spectabilis]|uniref:aspartate kinase n=1 Tax=Streptomyces spectabilis TaxID=68270 RepID=UPI001CEFA9F8|nr:aspartate kinase [Streptomyces spectabilis]